MMRALDTPEGRSAVARAWAERWLLAFDFDGTLAPFVRDPATAMIPGPVYTDLAAIAAGRPVAVITGRSRTDILARLPSGIAHVVGNHGCEQPDGDPSVLFAAEAMAQRWFHQLADLISGSGLRLESKGPSLALHWRGCVDPLTAERVAASLAMNLIPRPHLVEGDQVLNLLPPGLPDKGVALLRLMALTGSAGAMFIGDDVTDATVFRLRDPGILGIEVGYKGLGADWHLPDTTAVGALVHELAVLAENDGYNHV